MTRSPARPRGGTDASSSGTHWHVAPASFLILGFAGLGLPAGSAVSWFWIAALALNVMARLLIPADPSEGRRIAGEPLSASVRWRAASFLVDAALWTGLLVSVEPLAATLATRLGGALAGAILMSSLSTSSRATPLGLAFGWTIPVVAMAVHAASGPVIALGLLLWMASIVWLGATRPVPPPAPRTTRVEPVSGSGSGSTRRGIQLAIQTSAAPMIAIQNGRVFEINPSAAALLGGITFDCIGRRIGELALFDPPKALELAQLARNGPVPATLIPVGKVSGGPLPVRIKVGQSRGGDLLTVVAMETNAIPAVPANAAPALAPMPAAPDTVPSTRGMEVAEGDAAETVVLPIAAPVPRAPAADDRVAARALVAPIPPVAAAPPAPPATVPTRVPAPNETLSGAAFVSSLPGLPVLPNLMNQLPVLAWVVDGQGRVIHAHTDAIRRWGMKIGPTQRPRWWDAFVFQARSRESFERAVQSAIDGKPTYDLLVERASSSGGRLALRSHITPLAWPDALGRPQASALVLDTIASARELMDNDRLRRRKDHYKSLVEASPNLIWACDASFRFTFVSRRACRELYGYTTEDLVGVSLGVLLNPAADQAAARRALVALREGKVMRDVEMAHVTKDGRHIIVAVSAVALSGTNGGFSGAVGMMVDLTTLKQREASLAEALRVERTVLDSAGQALAVVRDGTVSRCNDAFLQLLQRPAEELQGLRISDIFADRPEWAAAMAAADRAALNDQAVVREIKLRRLLGEAADEQTVWCQLTLRSIDQGEYVVALADIDSIRRREAHALFDARHDELTGLANRRLFAERARAALATSALRNSGCAIVVIDLDRFKQINDRFGHQAGDEVLQEMARRLQRVVRPQDTVARYGGDEFALLIPDAGTRRDIEAITLRILDELARPVRVQGRTDEALSASVGIAMASEQGREPTWLLSLADRAMYEAKTSGGNRAVFAPVAEDLPLENPAASGVGRAA